MAATCLLIDGGSPFAAATRAGLEANFHVVRFDPGDEAGWDQLAPVDAIVLCAPSPELDAEAVITRHWLALREMIRLLPEGARGVFLSQHLAPGGDPARAAALESARISMAAAVVDGIGLERRPRANRLVIDPAASPAAIAQAVRFLTDPRSGFLCGAEIALDATQSAGETRLDGRTILVTGATSGLGRASCIAAGRFGAFVAVGGRKVALAEETLALVRAAGGDGMVVPLDVTDAGAWTRGIAAILAARGALHGLVNNAGESINRRIDQIQGADLAFLLAVNLSGPVLGMAAAEPALRASGGGAIVNVSSVAGIRGGPGGSAYAASKAAVIGHSLARGQVLATEVPRIRVNALQPGLIWSDSVADSLGEAGAAAFRARVEPRTPLGRVTTPEEVAEPICYLLSEAAAPIAAQAIHVSGGLELNFP
jgi:3alpha(or 20beta)-hydroxysteroid dehydrogenase